MIPKLVARREFQGILVLWSWATQTLSLSCCALLYVYVFADVDGWRFGPLLHELIDLFVLTSSGCPRYQQVIQRWRMGLETGLGSAS